MYIHFKGDTVNSVQLTLCGRSYEKAKLTENINESDCSNCKYYYRIRSETGKLPKWIKNG